MANFTQLEAGDVRAIADRLGLGAVRDVRPIDQGTINSNYALEHDGGRVFVRINEGKEAADVAYEAELVAALAQAGVATPPPLAAPDGAAYLELGGKLVSVFPWIEGEQRCAADASTEHVAAVGAALAELHRVGLALAERFERSGIYTHSAMVARLRDIAERDLEVLAPAVATIEEVLAGLEAHAPRRAAARRGIIHGDLFPDNVLFVPGRAEIAALIDFEQASTGSLVYDVAVCACAWCVLEGAVDGARLRSLVRGYEDVRPLASGERDAFYLEGLAVGARFTTTRITDVFLRQVDLPDKDYRETLSWIDAWSDLGEAGLAALLGWR